MAFNFHLTLPKVYLSLSLSFCFKGTSCYGPSRNTTVTDGLCSACLTLGVNQPLPCALQELGGNWALPRSVPRSFTSHSGSPSSTNTPLVLPLHAQAARQLGPTRRNPHSPTTRLLKRNGEPRSSNTPHAAAGAAQRAGRARCWAVPAVPSWGPPAMRRVAARRLRALCPAARRRRAVPRPAAPSALRPAAPWLPSAAPLRPPSRAAVPSRVTGRSERRTGEESGEAMRPCFQIHLFI